MMYAVDKINNDSTILPGLTVGMDGFDTCSSPELAGHYALQVVSMAQFGQSGSGQRPGAQGLLEHVYGFVGPNGDEECKLVNGVLNVSRDQIGSFIINAWYNDSNILWTYGLFDSYSFNGLYLTFSMVDLRSAHRFLCRHLVGSE